MTDFGTLIQQGTASARLFIPSAILLVGPYVGYHDYVALVRG